MAKGWGQGYLKRFTLPQSSPVARTAPSGDLAHAFTSDPSELAGNMPLTGQPYVQDHVAHFTSFRRPEAAMCLPFEASKKRTSRDSLLVTRYLPSAEKSRWVTGLVFFLITLAFRNLDLVS